MVVRGLSITLTFWDWFIPIYCHASYLALISILLINLTWQLMVAFILLWILIMFIKFIANSILWLKLLLNFNVKSGTTNGPIKMQQSKHLIKLIRTFYFLINILMNKSVFLTEFWWMFFRSFTLNKVATFNDQIHLQ